MKAINFNSSKKIKIRFEKIKPFVNYCKVTGQKEYCNVAIEYIPNNKVLDIIEYRKFFDKQFYDLIEDIAINVYDEIIKTIEPSYLKVTVFLEDNQDLTDWSVTIESDK